jgi:hypothetical protein
MPSCAICTTEAPASELSRQPLGARGGLVLVCRACDEEPAREVFGPERGRDFEEGAARISAQEFRKRCAAVIGDAPKFNRSSAWIDEKTPGFTIVRVSFDRAKPMDANEARETLRGMPWFRELRYLGGSGAHAIFERPSDELLGKIRQEKERAGTSIVLSAMERFRAKPHRPQYRATRRPTRVTKTRRT